MEAIKELFTTGNIVSISLFIAKPIIILIICKILINIVMKIVEKALDKSKLEKGMNGFIKSSAKILLWCISLIVVAGSIGIDTASLVTVLGVASLALSLSFQGIMTNVFSGITILISQPFKVGDYVEIAGVGGTVKEINLMRTVLTTPDCKIESVPNGDVCASRITNYSLEPMRRVKIKVSASYDANDIQYTVRFWTDNSEYWNTYFDVMEAIRENFAKHKIQFSYPHTIVHIDKN